MDGKMMDGITQVYADAWLLAVDKPAGLLVHGDGTGARTLTDLVREATGIACAQAVQRLDSETTGLVLFSLDKEVQPALDAAVASGAVRKRYIALVAGRLAGGERTIDAAIGRDRHDARRMRVSKTGKHAATIVRPLARYGNATLVELELLTGRRHQIRVHMASIGHPVVGDPKYGSSRRNDYFRREYGLKGQLLHSGRLVIPQLEGELAYLSGREFTAPVPKLFSDILRGEHLT